MAPPRHLLVWLAVLTSGATAALGWMGWQMLRQERDVESQRAQERLEHHADRIVQELERHLSDIDSRLSEWLSTPVTREEPRPAALGRGAVMSRVATRAVPAGALVFQPVVPARPEPRDGLFLEAERAEFQRRDYAAAAQSYRRLARSSDRAVRAAALMRLGRVLTTSGRPGAAIEAFDEMAALDDVPVAGLPAELVARVARARLLGRLKREDQARAAAAEVVDDLRRGRWAVCTSGTKRSAPAGSSISRSRTARASAARARSIRPPPL